MTRCRQFAEACSADPALTMEAHVAKGTDKGIRFHTDRQARVVGLVPGYRVADVENRGIGVLVRYELATLDWSKERPAVAPRALSRARTESRLTGRWPSAIQLEEVANVVSSILGGSREIDFDQPLMDVGIDSFLQSSLAQACVPHPPSPSYRHLPVPCPTLLIHQCTLSGVTCGHRG